MKSVYISCELRKSDVMETIRGNRDLFEMIDAIVYRGETNDLSPYVLVEDDEDGDWPDEPSPCHYVALT